MRARLRPNPAMSHCPIRFLVASSNAADMASKTIPAASITAMRRASTRDRVGSSLQAEAMAHHTTRRTRAIEIRKSGIGKRRCTHQWVGTARAAANSRSTTVPLGAITLTIGRSAAERAEYRCQKRPWPVQGPCHCGLPAGAFRRSGHGSRRAPSGALRCLADRVDDVIDCKARERHATQSRNGLSARRAPLGVGGSPEQRDGRAADRGRDVNGSRIVAHGACRAPRQGGDLAEAGAPAEIDRAGYLARNSGQDRRLGSRADQGPADYRAPTDVWRDRRTAPPASAFRVDAPILPGRSAKRLRAAPARRHRRPANRE